jgi:GT2 family glycosyltransferase
MTAVSVVIITLSRSAHLADCLSSLATQTYSDFEIVTVVIGNSREVPETEGSELAQKTRLVFTDFNVGYGAACNVGAKAANGSVLLFLNDDTVLQPDCLAQIHGVLSREGPCIAQPLIFHEYSNVWRRGNPCDVYGAAGIGFYGSCGTGEFYASGAAFAIGKEVFCSLGGFDETLFLYHDDVDLCWRARLSGIKILSVPQAKCVHAGGQSSKSIPHATKFYYTQRNRIRVLIKNYTGRRLIIRLPATISLVIAGSLFLSLTSRSASYVRSALRAIVWNLIILRNTLKVRFRVQSTRVRDDAAIEKAMSQNSMDLCVLRQHILSNATE